MPNLAKEIGRIFLSTRSILQKWFKKVTNGTSSAFKTVGTTMATILTTIMVLMIFCLLVLIAIPVGIVNGSPPKVKEVKTSFTQAAEPTHNPASKTKDEKNLD